MEELFLIVTDSLTRTSFSTVLFTKLFVALAIISMLIALTGKYPLYDRRKRIS